MKKLVKMILNFLSNLTCKSSCCGDSSCVCYSEHPDMFEIVNPELPFDFSNMRRVRRRSSTNPDLPIVFLNLSKVRRSSSI